MDTSLEARILPRNPPSPLDTDRRPLLATSNMPIHFCSSKELMPTVREDQSIVPTVANLPNWSIVTKRLTNTGMQQTFQNGLFSGVEDHPRHSCIPGAAPADRDGNSGSSRLPLSLSPGVVGANSSVLQR